MLEKLIEKAIGKHLQFHLIANNFIHPNQLRELKQQLITDTSIFLTHLIHLEWIENLQTSTLAFDIAQFLILPNSSHPSITS